MKKKNTKITSIVAAVCAAALTQVAGHAQSTNYNYSSQSDSGNSQSSQSKSRQSSDRYGQYGSNQGGSDEDWNENPQDSSSGTSTRHSGSGQSGLQRSNSQYGSDRSSERDWNRNNYQDGRYGNSSNQYGSGQSGSQGYGSHYYSGSSDRNNNQGRSYGNSSEQYGTGQYGQQRYGGQRYGSQGYGGQDYGGEYYGGSSDRNNTQGRSYGSSRGQYGAGEFGSQGYGRQRYGQDYGSNWRNPGQSSGSQSSGQDWQQQSFMSSANTFTGKIQDFDEDDNTLTIEGDQGTRKFKIGDEVTVRYRSENGTRELVALTQSQGSQSSRGGSESSQNAYFGGQSSSSRMSFQGEVRKVDKDDETITVKGDQGTRRFHVNDDSKLRRDGSKADLGDFEKGEQVNLQYHWDDGDRMITSLRSR